MPGFGEQMRQLVCFVPTAILSRQVAVIRETADHAALILNLPGQIEVDQKKLWKVSRTPMASPSCTAFSLRFRIASRFDWRTVYRDYGSRL